MEVQEDDMEVQEEAVVKKLDLFKINKIIKIIIFLFKIYFFSFLYKIIY